MSASRGHGSDQHERHTPAWATHSPLSSHCAGPGQSLPPPHALAAHWVSHSARRRALNAGGAAPGAAAGDVAATGVTVDLTGAAPGAVAVDEAGAPGSQRTPPAQALGALAVDVAGPAVGAHHRRGTRAGGRAVRSTQLVALHHVALARAAPPVGRRRVDRGVGALHAPAVDAGAIARAAGIAAEVAGARIDAARRADGTATTETASGGRRPSRPGHQRTSDRDRGAVGGHGRARSRSGARGADPGSTRSRPRPARGRR
jgi:hypothetical protein